MNLQYTKTIIIHIAQQLIARMNALNRSTMHSQENVIRNHRQERSFYEKTLSIILAFLLFLSAVPSAFAQDVPGYRTAQKNSVYMSSIVVLDNSRNRNIYMVSEDYSNDDAQVTIYDNNVPMYTTYLYRAQNTLESTDYTTPVPTVTIHTIDALRSTASPASNTNYIDIGRIYYDIYSQGYVMSTNPIDISRCMTVTPEKDCELYGRYDNIAQVVSYLAFAMDFPAFAVSAFAKAIFAKLGVAATGALLLSSAITVKGTMTHISWLGTNPYNASQTHEFSGSLYEFEHHDGDPDSYTDGNYFDEDSFEDEDERFALQFPAGVFGAFDSFEVNRWE